MQLITDLFDNKRRSLNACRDRPPGPHRSGDTCHRNAAVNAPGFSSGLALVGWLQQRRQRIGVFIGLYVLIVIPLLLQQPLITSFALLPLVLVPPVGWLIYWLVWQEFHG